MTQFLNFLEVIHCWALGTVMGFSIKLGITLHFFTFTSISKALLCVEYLPFKYVFSFCLYYGFRFLRLETLETLRGQVLKWDDSDMGMMRHH